MVTLTTGIMFLLLTCIHFCVWGKLRRLSTWAQTACEVGSCWRKFERYWCKKCSFRVVFVLDKRNAALGTGNTRFMTTFPSLHFPYFAKQQSSYGPGLKSHSVFYNQKKITSRIPHKVSSYHNTRSKKNITFFMFTYVLSFCLRHFLQ
jgi:hypothetical protein